MKEESMKNKVEKDPGRRKFLKTGLALAEGSLLASSVGARNFTEQRKEKNQNTSTNTVTGSRKLAGKLEVSGVGLGVQNMSRTYQTTIPYRPEMINIIRTAFDHGVTLFDTAEAYGPFESERILGEAVVPFRNKVVIETKFGWNIDQETGRNLMGFNSRPEHIKIVVENMLKRLRTDRIDPEPGRTQMVHMLENIGADDVKFTADELKQFNTELSKIEIKGERLPKVVLDFSGVEAPLKK